MKEPSSQDELAPNIFIHRETERNARGEQAKLKEAIEAEKVYFLSTCLPKKCQKGSNEGHNISLFSKSWIIFCLWYGKDLQFQVRTEQDTMKASMEIARLKDDLLESRYSKMFNTCNGHVKHHGIPKKAFE